MKVSTIMSSPVVTVHLDDRLSAVREIFSRTRFHHLIVVEHGKLFGVVSDRDLLKAISPNIGKGAERDADTATLNKRVHQIMSRKPIFLQEESSVLDAIRLFDEHAVSCIPIVNPDNTPVGILSWRDIIKAIRAVSQKEKP
ncbi:MAG TPA: CBS domain-containing protein [Pseudomonadales bacterium]|nr:CBS domain-containing protein [Pseudomonadales bacterium]